MRLTPAQSAIHLLCGNPLPRGAADSMQERIELGRRLLAELAHVDFGYDLQQWHDHLKHSRDGGYTWHKSVALPKIMRDALASPEWNEAVASLSESDASVPRGLGRR